MCLSSKVMDISVRKMFLYSMHAHVALRMWNDVLFDYGTLNGFKIAVNRWLLPLTCFLTFSSANASRVIADMQAFQTLVFGQS